MNQQCARLWGYNSEQDNKEFTFSSTDINTAVKQALCRKIKQGKGRVTEQGVLSEMGGSGKFFLKCRERGKGHVKF